MTKKETMSDLVLTEIFSFLVSMVIFLFLIDFFKEKTAVVMTTVILAGVSYLGFRISHFGLSASSFVAGFILVMVGILDFHMSRANILIFSSMYLYLCVTIAILMVGLAGLRFRLSAMTLFLEGILVWVGFTYLPKLIS